MDVTNQQVSDFILRNEMICFSYPTLLREGLMANGVYTPEPLITGVAHDTGYTLIITAGLTFPIGITFTTEIDITYDDKSVINETAYDSNGYQETPFFSITEDDKAIYLSSMFVKNVHFREPGCYKITINIYTNDADGAKSGTPVTSHNSYFYVSSINETQHGSTV